MPRALHEFVNLHRGQTAYLFGKGPSLNRWQACPAALELQALTNAQIRGVLAARGEIVGAINDVARVAPGCTYCFANDSVQAWAHVYAADHILFTPLRAWNDAFLQGWDGPPKLPCEVVTYADDYDDARLFWPRERLGREGLTIRPGTLGSALQILHLMGFAKVVLIGFDGGRVHAKGDWLTELRNDHARDYGHIRTQAAQSARLMRLPIEFYGRDPLLNPDSTMTVKFLNSTQVGGDPYPSGAIADIPDNEARDLQGMGHVHILTAEELAALRATQTDAAPADEGREAAAAPAATEAAVPAAPEKKSRRTKA